MEIAALCVSIISIIISCIVANIGYRKDYRLSRINIEVDFFREIYKEHLVYGIPRARMKMYIGQDKKIHDADDLITELNAIRKDSLFFKFKNNKFYNELINALRQLEDYIVNAEGGDFDSNDRAIFESNVELYISKIYEIITQAYNGELWTNSAFWTVL